MAGRLMMCSVYDEKVGCFMQPFCVRSRGEAIRGFMDACRDEKMAFHMHPEDYKLYLVGEFLEDSGQLVSALAELLISGDQVG